MFYFTCDRSLNAHETLSRKQRQKSGAGVSYHMRLETKFMASKINTNMAINNGDIDYATAVLTRTIIALSVDEKCKNQ